MHVQEIRFRQRAEKERSAKRASLRPAHPMQNGWPYTRGSSEQDDTGQQGQPHPLGLPRIDRAGKRRGGGGLFRLHGAGDRREIPAHAALSLVYRDRGQGHFWLPLPRDAGAHLEQERGRSRRSVREAAYGKLLPHLHKFGFILRYPAGKESVTGYPFEPWHIRYVGIDAAREMYDAGWTLEEYVSRTREELGGRE